MKWLGFPPKDYSLLILLPSTPPTLRPSFLSLPFTPPTLRLSFLSFSLSLLLPSACPSSLSPFHSSHPPPVLPLSPDFRPSLPLPLRHVSAHSCLQSGVISDTEWSIYSDWHSFLLDVLPLTIDAIVYLKTDPKVAYQGSVFPVEASSSIPKTVICALLPTVVKLGQILGPSYL